jgi:periplasmic mercuric ion binding protein
MNRAMGSFVGSLAVLLVASIAAADATVTVEKTHLCCNACVQGVSKAVSTVQGAKARCDRDAQKAVDALLAAGYFGKADGATMKDDAGAPSGKVKTLEVSGFHNCCKKCTTTLNDTIKKVPGAAGEVEAKKTTMTVTGDFDAQKLVDELNAAGFAVKVK